MTKVKICGITNVEDAALAVAAGADAIGFIFAESPRRISPHQARDIWRAVDDKKHREGKNPCVAVGVFVDEDPEHMVTVAQLVGLHVLQLHGSEPPEIVEKMCALGFDVVKSFRVSAEKRSVAALEAYHPTAFQLDTYVPGKPGGTGETFDWRLAREANRCGRVILSGGLGVDNVREAIRVAAPYGVDASSRLEVRPGVKDHDLVRAFVRLAKSVGPDVTEDKTWPR